MELLSKESSETLEMVSIFEASIISAKYFFKAIFKAYNINIVITEEISAFKIEISILFFNIIERIKVAKKDREVINRVNFPKLDAK